MKNSVQVQSQESSLISVQAQDTGRSCITDLTLFEGRASSLSKQYIACVIYILWAAEDVKDYQNRNF